MAGVPVRSRSGNVLLATLGAVYAVAGVTKATLRQHDLTLDLRRVNDARKRFFLDDATVGKLAGAPSSPPYPLQSALEMLPP